MRFVNGLKIAIVLMMVIVATWSYKCDKKSRQFNKCLMNGYTPTRFEGCKIAETSMTDKKDLKKCTRYERKLSKRCKSFECEPNWMPLDADRFGDVEVASPNFPEFVAKLTQAKVLDRWISVVVEVTLFDSDDKLISFTDFTVSPSLGLDGTFTASGYKQLVIFKEVGFEKCSSEKLTLDYLYDTNVELKTDVEDFGRMFQFTTSDGEVHTESMSWCSGEVLTLWQETLEKAVSAKFKRKTPNANLLEEYITTEYKIVES